MDLLWRLHENAYKAFSTSKMCSVHASILITLKEERSHCKAKKSTRKNEDRYKFKKLFVIYVNVIQAQYKEVRIKKCWRSKWSINPLPNKNLSITICYLFLCASVFFFQNQHSLWVSIFQYPAFFTEYFPKHMLSTPNLKCSGLEMLWISDF